MKLGPVLTALESLYDDLRAEHPGLPDATITIEVKPSPLYGYAYKRRIVVGWKAVREGGQILVETILHEAAHLIQYEQMHGIGNKAHDSFFRDACTVLGLEDDRLSAESSIKYASLIQRLDSILAG